MAEVMRQQVCEAECRNDGFDNNCTPGDDSPSCPCHCPSLQTSLPLLITAVTIIPGMQPGLLFDSRDRVPPSPDPREILHVPRRAV